MLKKDCLMLVVQNTFFCEYGLVVTGSMCGRVKFCVPVQVMVLGTRYQLVTVGWKVALYTSRVS